MLDLGLAGRQIVGGAVSDRVGPAYLATHAVAGVGGDQCGQRAKRGANRLHRYHVGVGQIGVGEGHRAGAGQIRRGGVFRHRAISCRGDHRRLVGAGDGHRDVLRRGAAMTVGDRDREMLDLGLAGRQIVGGAVSDRVGPAYLATHAVAGVGGDQCGQRAKRGADRLHRYHVGVGQIGVGEGHRAGAGQIRRGGVFRHRAIAVRGDHRRLVVPVMVTATSCDVVPP